MHPWAALGVHRYPMLTSNIKIKYTNHQGCPWRWGVEIRATTPGPELWWVPQSWGSGCGNPMPPPPASNPMETAGGQLHDGNGHTLLQSEGWKNVNVLVSSVGATWVAMSIKVAQCMKKVCIHFSSHQVSQMVHCYQSLLVVQAQNQRSMVWRGCQSNLVSMMSWMILFSSATWKSLPQSRMLGKHRLQ